MLLPGRMSWNWLSSTPFQHLSSVSSGYATPSCAATDHISASRSASSLLRLPRLMAAWLV